MISLSFLIQCFSILEHFIYIFDIFNLHSHTLSRKKDKKLFPCGNSGHYCSQKINKHSKCNWSRTKLKYNREILNYILNWRWILLLWNTGHFNLYVHVSCRVIYAMTTKFLYLKNEVISLIFKIWLGMEGKKTYSWNVYTFLQVLVVHIKINCSFIMMKFHNTFFGFQSSVPFTDNTSTLKCWSWFVIRFVCLDFNW